MKCDSQQQNNGYLQHSSSAAVPCQTSQITLYMNTVWNMYELMGCSYRKDQMPHKSNLDLINAFAIPTSGESVVPWKSNYVCWYASKF